MSGVVYVVFWLILTCFSLDRKYGSLADFQSWRKKRSSFIGCCNSVFNSLGTAFALISEL